MLDLIVKQQLPVITTNFDLVKAELEESIKKYKGMVVTEETLKSCKADQIMLGKMEKKIDEYRITTKRVAEEPIKEFEDNCNTLKSVISNAKIPLKANIQVFDDAEKEKKKLIAIEHINKTITDLVLNDKYSIRLTVLDTYGNVSMSIKKLKEDIEKRGYLLQQEQQQEAENLQIIKDTIENCNKNIDAKLDIQDFQMMINANETISIILHTINERAERIKVNELKAIADNKAKAEKLVLERIEKAKREEAEKTRIEERNIQIAKEAAEDTERLKRQNLAKIERELKEEKENELRIIAQNQIDLDAKLEKEANEKIFKRQKETKSEIANYAKETIPPIKEKVKMYFIEMRVEGEIEKIMELSKFLKENHYSYKASDKGSF